MLILEHMEHSRGVVEVSGLNTNLPDHSAPMVSLPLQLHVKQRASLESNLSLLPAPAVASPLTSLEGHMFSSPDHASLSLPYGNQLICKNI